MSKSSGSKSSTGSRETSGKGSVPAPGQPHHAGYPSKVYKEPSGDKRYNNTSTGK